MKKKLFVIAAAVICLAILASGTLAYFTHEDEVRNIITSGGVEIALSEWQDQDGTLVPYPDEPVEIMPGARVSKIVTVENLEADAWIRATFDVVIYDPEGNVMPHTAEELAAIVTVATNGEAWTEQGGWFYHDERLTAGGTTAPLLTEVVFAGAQMSNEYQHCTVELTVRAQAVQADNNGDSALSATGWPE